MSRYPPKSDHLSEILGLHPDTERWCAGSAPSQGRRCHNPINAANRTSAVQLLDEGSRRMKRGEDINDLLMNLASLVLCRHVHQKGQGSQVPGLVKKWQEQIRGVGEDLDNVEAIGARQEVKHMGFCRETDEVETSRRSNRFSLSSRLQPSWHENLPLQSSVEAPNSSKLKVDRRARPSGSNDGTTRRARVSSAGVSGAITTTSSRHAVSITEQPGLFTAPAPTLRASTPSSTSSSQSSGSSPSRPLPLSLSTSDSSPTISTPMVNPRATVAPASSSRASATTSMSASTSASTSIATSVTSPTSARASPSRAAISGSGHTETAFSRVPAPSPRGSVPASRRRTPRAAHASRSDTTTTTSTATTTTTSVTSTRTITVSTSSSTSTATPTTSTSSPRVTVSNVGAEASASDPAGDPARPRTASTTATPAAPNSARTTLASTSTAIATAGASSTSDPTSAPTTAPTIPAPTAAPTANATPEPTTTTSQPDTSSPAVVLQPPQFSSSSSSSSNSSATTPSISGRPPLVPKPTYTPARKPITGDCSICYEPLLPDSPFTTPHQASRDLSIVYCKQQCGTNFHFSCLFTWKKSVLQMDREPSCPMCRAAWP